MTSILSLFVIPPFHCGEQSIVKQVHKQNRYSAVARSMSNKSILHESQTIAVNSDVSYIYVGRKLPVKTLKVTLRLLRGHLHQVTCSGGHFKYVEALCGGLTLWSCGSLTWSVPSPNLMLASDLFRFSSDSSSKVKTKSFLLPEVHLVEEDLIFNIELPGSCFA